MMAEKRATTPTRNPEMKQVVIENPVLNSLFNEPAWQSLHTNVSRPFDKPKSGKIAVKVINHYGDEVLTVRKIKGKR
jgi:hypothetical protein